MTSTEEHTAINPRKTAAVSVNVVYPGSRILLLFHLYASSYETYRNYTVQYCAVSRSAHAQYDIAIVYRNKFNFNEHNSISISNINFGGGGGGGGGGSIRNKFHEHKFLLQYQTISLLLFAAVKAWKHNLLRRI